MHVLVQAPSLQTSHCWHCASSVQHQASPQTPLQQ
jgi:hypothetical protein